MADLPDFEASDRVIDHGCDEVGLLAATSHSASENVLTVDL